MTRIAVADDDHELRTLIADLLRDRGLDVVEASDGATLLAMLHQGGISLVVTDLWMPRLSGSDVLQLRRSSGDTTPFVLITAAPTAVAEQVLDAAGVKVLYKPFTEESILRVIHESLAVVAAGTPPVGLTTVVATTETVAAAAELDRDDDPDQR
jgi:CheY-like chemotaxis protein